MLIANKTSAGFGKVQFGVTANGEPVGTVDDSHSTFDVQGRKFQIVRSGVLEVKRVLKSGETELVTATQQPLRNHHTLTVGGKEFTYKATSLSAAKFGLFENESQTGTVSSGVWYNRTKNITADLPDELPQEIQMFLLAIFISVLMSE